MKILVSETTFSSSLYLAVRACASVAPWMFLGVHEEHPETAAELFQFTPWCP